MAKYDAEALLSDIGDHLAANLNTKLAAITAEKADGIVLPTLHASAFFFQTLGEAAINLNPFLIYGIVDQKDEGIGPAVSERIMIQIAIVVSDRLDGNIGKRLLRYRRALRELFTGSFDKIGNAVKFKVTSLVPISLELINSDEPQRAIGIQVETTLVGP